MRQVQAFAPGNQPAAHTNIKADLDLLVPGVYDFPFHQEVQHLRILGFLLGVAKVPEIFGRRVPILAWPATWSLDGDLGTDFVVVFGWKFVKAGQMFVLMLLRN